MARMSEARWTVLLLECILQEMQEQERRMATRVTEGRSWALRYNRRGE